MAPGLGVQDSAGGGEEEVGKPAEATPGGLAGKLIPRGFPLGLTVAARTVLTVGKKVSRVWLQ